MHEGTAAQIRIRLTAGRIEADRLIAEAEKRARALLTSADRERGTLAESQLERLSEIQAQLSRDGELIDATYVRLTETMAAASVRLAEAAREADFSLPPWPGGIGRTVEIKLSETREVTLRFATGGPSGELRNERQ